MKSDNSVAILTGLLSRLQTVYSVSYIAAKVDALAAISRKLHKLAETECNRELTKGEHSRILRLEREAQNVAWEVSTKLVASRLSDPRAGCGLAFFWKDAKDSLPGNTMGGDESGFYL